MNDVVQSSSTNVMTPNRWEDTPLAGLNVGGSTEFGALRFVPEAFWKRAHKGSYNSRSDRVGHPGCSLGLHPKQTLSAVMYVLHGTSGKSKAAVCVRDVDSQGWATYFGGLPAVPIQAKFWRNDCRPCLKPRLSAAETAQVKNLFRKKRKIWGVL
jgi:hypothetical protein